MAGIDKALVIGRGSAGLRHARVLAELGLTVAFVSRRGGEDAHPALEPALAAERPGYVVVADETARHAETLTALAAAGFEGPVLVEKPLFEAAHPLPAHGFSALWVGYQLRFHPVIQRLRRRLKDQKAVTVQAYVGQHLSGWRPDRPLQGTYSGSRAGGGGALRDLSHEIDLLLWLFGDWTRLAALGGSHGVLPIDSDDAFALLMVCEGCPLVSLQMNYLDRPGRRSILVNGATATLEADLVKRRFRLDEREEDFAADQTDPTLAMHRAVLAGGDERLCNGAAGMKVMAAIEAAERSVAEGAWISA